MGGLTDKYFICSRICSALALGCCFASTMMGSSEQEMPMSYMTREDQRLESSWTLEESKYHSYLHHGQSRRPRSYGLGILPSVPGSTQNGFTKVKSHLTNMTVFQNIATSPVGEGGGVDVVSFAFIQLLTPVALLRKTLGNWWSLSWPWARNAFL